MIEQYITQRYPSCTGNVVAYRQELIRVCNEFVDRNLADPKFVRELTSGNEGKFWSCISEALLAERLRHKEFPLRDARGVGPDFLVMDGNRKVWIEVVCPEPRGLPGPWFKFHTGVIDFPNIEILLRWTAAIKAKAERLTGSVDGVTAGYLQNGIVSPEDSYVIAVNCCQLRNGPFSALFGISQFPFAVEAVFPVGPYQLRIDRETLDVVDQGHQHRPYITNANGAQVPAYTFLDPRFNCVSAIWAVDLNGGSVVGNSEPMIVVHNPNAENPISLGFLPSDNEYVATQNGNNDYVLNKIDGIQLVDDYYQLPRADG